MEAGVESRLATALVRGGAPLPAGLRRNVEGVFGVDFGAVRLHDDPQANVLSRDVGAHAFTLGTDIFFRDPGLDLTSDKGIHLLAHELTHSVQQRGSPQSSRAAAHQIRRSVGFEFETRDVFTGQSKVTPPRRGFPTPADAGLAWKSARKGLAKGRALLSRPDIEIQADEVSQDTSDLEVVVNHVPETPAGRVRLDAALTALQSLITRFVVLAPRPLWTPPDRVVPAARLDGTAGFKSKMRDGLIHGEWDTATTAPQVTMGVRARNLPNLVKDLHGAPGETAPQGARRDPGRLHMRNPAPTNAAEPKLLTPLDEAQTLVTGHSLARLAIRNYRNKVDIAAPGGPSLTGFLTIVFSYVESMVRKAGFLKNHTPLMAKTDLATVWRTLPPRVIAYYGQLDNTGTSRLERLVEHSAPGYPAKMTQPLFAGVSGLVQDDNRGHSRQWYHTLTLQDWLRSIAVDRTPTKAEAIRDLFRAPKSRGTDKLTTENFPGLPANQVVEGYGVLGSRMDEHAPTGDKLPVFELRSASKRMTYSAAQQWALDMFDYIVSLNTHPRGGYTHMLPS